MHRRCQVIVFSPTGTTRKVALSVADGLGLPQVMRDITPSDERNIVPSLRSDDVLLFAAPVYYGRVARHAAEYFAALKGQGQAALAVVNYGNRHYDDALLELCTLLGTLGFKPFAAAAFVSEHSFSTRIYPMAPGRPDADDLSLAVSFGTRAARKLEEGAEVVENVPGNAPYKSYPDFHRAPVSTEACTLCGVCVEMCPTGAITLNANGLFTNERACIVCQACVKNCPEDAREDSASGALETRQHLLPLVEARREPEFFL